MTHYYDSTVKVWLAKSFAAKVIHVHSGGKVDVVYDVDGTVGIFLTAEQHGLKLLGDEEKVGGRHTALATQAPPVAAVLVSSCLRVLAHILRAGHMQCHHAVK